MQLRNSQQSKKQPIKNKTRTKTLPCKLMIMIKTKYCYYNLKSQLLYPKNEGVHKQKREKVKENTHKDNILISKISYTMM